MNAIALFHAVAIVVTSVFALPATTETVSPWPPHEAEIDEACIDAGQAAPLESLEYRAPESPGAAQPASARIDEWSRAIAVHPADFSQGGTF